MARGAQLPANDRVPPRKRLPLRRSRRRKLKYHAFLSYSHKDEAIADWLHEELEAFRVPPSLVGRLAENGPIPRRLTPIFRDEHELAAADDLGDEIEAALASAQVLIVLCSPNAAQSHWTNAEIMAFKRSRPEGCILAAIVSGEPFASDIAGREDEECFPPALRQKYDSRGRPTGKRAEPLAADLRDSGDGRRMGFLKLVAGMLGVGLDDLVQRETTQRHRRLAWLTAASLAGTAVASGLAITAIQARDSARDQRREAEGLVEFMLGDLKDELEPIGKLDVLDGVGSRVLAYYSKQDASQLSDQGLAQRSQALTLMGKIADSRVNLDAASGLFHAAMKGTEESLRRAPDDPKRIFDHAQNVFYLGDLARRRGQMDEAETAYREYKRLADRMAAIEPDNLKWRMEAAYADSNIGIVLRGKRQFPEAARRIRSAIGVMQGLASIEPGNEEYQFAQANTLGWLADAERDQGHLDAAIGIRQRQVDFVRQRIASGSENANLRARLIPAHQGLGILFTSQGQFENGIEQLRLAVAEADRMIAIEPGNMTWKGYGAQARLELASTLLSVKRRAEAATEARKGCDWSAQVLARDSRAIWRHLQTACLSVRTRLAMESGENAMALGLAERALASARSERNEDRNRTRFAIASASRLLGDVRQRMGDSDAARVAWTAGLAQLPRNVPERPVEMSERAGLLKRIGLGAEAQQVSSRLAVMGYRNST